MKKRNCPQHTDLSLGIDKAIDGRRRGLFSMSQLRPINCEQFTTGNS